MNFSGVRLDMSFKEAKELDAMISRNKAMPPTESSYIKDGETHKYYMCSVCGEFLLEGDKFCRACGQKIDTENIAL